MNARFDRAARSVLRAMLRAAVMSMTSGVHHLPPEIVGSKAAGDAMRALRAAFEALRDNSAASATRDLSDELAAVLDVVCDLRDALAPLARDGFGPVELYSRAAVARAAPIERRGAPIAAANNLVRLPVNAGHALASDEQTSKAKRASALASSERARSLTDALDFLKSCHAHGTKSGDAIRGAIDACHEVQKFYGNDWDEAGEARVLADYWDALNELARAGFGSLELDLALQRAMVERAERERASSPKGVAMTRLARAVTAGGPMLVALPKKRASKSKRGA